jgi:hypothetical protein
MEFLKRSRNMQSHNTRKVLVVAAFSLVAAQIALAQGVGNPGSLPTQFQTGTPANGWLVDSTAGAIPVILDPLGPAWGKSFTGPNGGPFSYNPFAGPLPVTELLVVAPNSPSWTDWHEEVLDPSGQTTWSWANPTMLVNGLPAPGLTTSLSGNSVSFFFNPIFPGDTVTIRKDLVLNNPNPGQLFTGTLAIHEFPTPEPASMALLGLGSAFMLRRRSRTTAA